MLFQKCEVEVEVYSLCKFYVRPYLYYGVFYQNPAKMSEFKQYHLTKSNEKLDSVHVLLLWL